MCIIDYLIQTQFEANNKALGRFWNHALLSHCLKYTLVFVPVLYFVAASSWWLALIFSSHMFLDRRWFVYWWRRTFMRNDDAAIKNSLWLTIVVDQIFHLFILALIAAME
jgi:hypothetical protein